MADWPVKDKAELMKELDLISKVHGDYNTRVLATALAYLINELVPNDRTTKSVFTRAEDLPGERK